MSSRDFSGLSPFDFEGLVRDLLWEHWSIPVESFTQGRDRGIDLRALVAGRRPAPPMPGFIRIPSATRSAQETWIVQCKHYAASGYNKLKAKVLEETEKVAALKPDRYVLATTVGLTPDRKQELFKLLQPWCRSEQDILGADDIEALIVRYPDVERANFKLWLNSVGVLEQVLHNDVVARTEGYRDDLERNAHILCITRATKTQWTFCEKNTFASSRAHPA
jgi:hypothetical protein